MQKHPKTARILVYHPRQNDTSGEKALDIATVLVSLAGLISAFLFLITMS